MPSGTKLTETNPQVKDAPAPNGQDTPVPRPNPTPRVRPVMAEETDDIPNTSRGGHWDEFVLGRVEQARERGGESKAGVFHDTSPTTSSYINKTYNLGSKGKGEDRLNKVLGVKGRVVASIRHTRDVETDERDPKTGKFKVVKRGTMFVKVFLDESELG